MEASPALTSAQRSLAAKPSRAQRAANRTLEKLYDRHARDVYQYALALLANPADAEDATQTTFLNAYRALLRGDRPHRPHNWLITITHNVCRMRWRQAGQRPREVALDDVPEPLALERERPDLAEVLNALARLTFNQRAALVMRELEGRSCKEIARTLDVSVSSVEALLFRARRRLQLERDALGVLTTAPFPAAKLLSALGIGGGGGGGAAAGGAALGANLVVKAVALVAVGAIVTGAVGVATHVGRLHKSSAPAKVQTARSVAVTKAATRAKTRPVRTAIPVERTKPTGTQAQAPAGTTAAVPTRTAPAQPTPTVQAPSIQLPSVQVPQLPAQLPQPQLPAPPVQLPSVQVPQLPVQPPQLPPLPPLITP